MNSLKLPQGIPTLLTLLVLKPKQLRNFLSKQQPDSSGCILWVGARTGTQRGLFTLNGVSISAHRLAYRIAVGPIPNSMHVSQRCRNSLCVNSGHLFIKKKNTGRKLSEGHVTEIKKMIYSGVSYPKIAAKFRVSHSMIGLIASKRAWLE